MRVVTEVEELCSSADVLKSLLEAQAKEEEPLSR